ncbi:hypothetical protein Pmar_PMAR009209 [Perkinsus marinus ATCC 50983]|uniref:Uncharacterized protein n=1 Tax=Perkinsus marinus (strain ATCC 50983 / TXsc) TaxID=423536 RepID=C5LE32_PERM5|nr:hypothetical protein Pmar_PMAR009209 [Perkinsus marinus ATCC 50983]EER05030.1 hypothetical protein Pmar_PMAR009209 [Perkinsus marinus ATCC 50983]|eukprot:XP_002773214.1 hypothetical protein Pmar_PMAR009209 [Perkinsus marinus ATCC 50983]
MYLRHFPTLPTHRPRLASFMIPIIFAVWWSFTDDTEKIRSVCGAVIYAFIESAYLTFHEGHFNSTFAQFWCNIWYHPIVMDVYRRAAIPALTAFLLDRSDLLRFHFDHDPLVLASVLAVCLMPINIWCLEAVQGYLIILLYGENIAWDYSYSKFSFAGGNCNLAMVVEWLVFGLALERIYWPFIVPVFEGRSVGVGAAEYGIWF